MELKLIIEKTCSICGAATIAESCRNYYFNGEGFERREFACGRILIWSPNFSCLMDERICTNSAEYKDKKSHRQLVIDEVLAFIKKLDIKDESLRKKLEYEVGHIAYPFQFQYPHDFQS